MAREVRIAIIGDPSSLQRALRTADTGVTRFGARMQTFGTRMRSFGASMSRNLTLPLVGFGVLAYRELSAGERALAQTQAVIESTGGAARQSVDDILELSHSLSQLTSIDDEPIQEAANTLLTFREIAGDTFEEATRATLDLSVAMDRDLRSSAVMVGRALNDPIRGMAALTRVGVQFTDEQRAAIEAMVAFGDTAGAQQLILEELNAEFGGSAEALGTTTAGRLNRLKNSMEELGASILENLMPALEDLAGLLTGLAEKYNGLTDSQQKWVAGLIAALAVAGPLASALGGLATVLGWLATAAGAVVGAIGGMGLAVVAAAAVVVGGAIYIATHWRETTDFLRNAWNNISGVARAVWANIAATIRSAATSAANAVRQAVDDMMGFIRSIPGRAGAIASGFGGVLVGAGRAIIQGLWDGMQAVWGSVTSWLSGLADIIPDWKGPMEKDRKILIPTGRVIMEGLGAGMRQGWDEDVTPFLRSATADTGRFIPRRGRQQQASSTGIGDPSDFARAVARELGRTIQPVMVVG